MTAWRQCCGVLLLLVYTAGSLASPQGQPLMRRFSVAEHGGTPYSQDVITDADGFLYVANGSGVLRFDGSLWDIIELPAKAAARSLHIDRQGRFFVGSYDLFGELVSDATGAMQFVDLRPRFGLSSGSAAFGEVWDIVSTSAGVYLRTDPSIFFLGADGSEQQWPSSPDLRRMFVIDDQIYARVDGQGLSRFVDGRFELIGGGETFRDEGVVALLDRPEGALVVGNRSFFRLREQRLQAADGDQAIFVEHSPNTALRLGDGSLLLGTQSGVLLHYDGDLRLQARYPLGPFPIFDLTSDREGGVWVGTQNDLVRVRLPSPWSAFTHASGIHGSVSDTAFYDGSLWLAGSSGVFRSREQNGAVRFEQVVATELEAWSLLADRAGLLIGERTGLLLYDPARGQPRQLLDTPDIYDLQTSRYDADLIFVQAEQEVLLLRRHGDDWRPLARWPLGEIGLNALTEEASDRVWVDNYRGYPQRWRYDPASGEVLERETFGSEQGLVIDPDYGSWVVQLDGELYAISGSHVFVRRDQRFVPAEVEPFTLVEQPYELGISETEFGDFAYHTRQLFHRIPGTRDWQVLHLGDAMANGISNMQTDADGKLRAVSWGGVLQFDPAVAEPPLAPLQVRLRELLWRQPGGDSRRLPLDTRGPLPLASGDSLVFDYGMVSMAPGSEYRARIDGLTDVWSDWAPPSRPALSLRISGPGQYTLRVEGRTQSGRRAEPLVFAFEVAPRWWQTPGARAGGLFLALLGLLLGSHGIARFRYRQYLALNRRLEQKIAERTTELEQANRKLAELATEDGLTGVANRRALEQGLNREWQRCGALGQPLAVMMIDVDHFKQFNDRFGHLEGDQQLIRVAGELAARVLPVRELLARFGGEEFAIVMPGIDIDQAAARAEQIRAAFDHEGFATTVSVGVSAEIPLPHRNPNNLLQDADLALYEAKRGGRNRVRRAAVAG